MQTYISNFITKHQHDARKEWMRLSICVMSVSFIVYAVLTALFFAIHSGAGILIAALLELVFLCVICHAICTFYRTLRKSEMPSVCPESGEFNGWKTSGQYLIELRIPADARRVSVVGAKRCHADKALVTDIVNLEKDEQVESVASMFDENFVYRKGEGVKSERFEENPMRLSGSGIYLSKATALEEKGYFEHLKFGRHWRSKWLKKWS